MSSPFDPIKSGVIFPLSFDAVCCNKPIEMKTGKQPERVQLSKEAFKRAMECREFLWDVPAYILTLKGINNIVDLIRAVLISEMKEVSAMASLADEIQTHIGMVSGQIDGYTPRKQLEEEHNRFKKKLIKQFFNLQGYLNDVSNASLGQAALDRVIQERNEVGKIIAPCMECKGTGEIEYGDDESIDDIVDDDIQCEACDGCGFDHSYFDSIKLEDLK